MVLNEEHRQVVLIPNLLNVLRQLLSLLGIHARRRFVQQQQGGLGGQGPGDFQTALEAVGQAGCDFVLILLQSLLLQQRHGFRPHPGFLLGVGAEDGGKHILLGPHMLGNQHVFKDGHALPQPDVLEGSGNAQLHHIVRRGIHNGL